MHRFQQGFQPGCLLADKLTHPRITDLLRFRQTFPADVNHIVFDFFAAEGRVVALGLVTADGIGGNQIISGLKQGFQHINPRIIIVVVERERHNATRLQMPSGFRPACRQCPAVKLAGGFRSVQRICVSDLQIMVTGIGADAFQIRLIDIHCLLVFLPVVRMLHAVVDGFRAVRRPLRLEILSFRLAIIPFQHRNTQPNIEEIRQVRIKKIIAKWRIGDHKIIVSIRNHRNICR